MWFNLMYNNSIYITEGHPRGMASNLICLLGALRKYPDKKIVIVPPFMSLYALDHYNGFNHFFRCLNRVYCSQEPLRTGEKKEIFDMGKFFPLPSYEEDMLSNGGASTDIIESLSIVFARELRFTEDCAHYIRSHLRLLKTNGAWNYGVHRRASDHGMHTKILKVENFSNKIAMFLKAEKVAFVASDDLSFHNTLCSDTNCKIIGIPAERSGNSVGVHFMPSSSENRVKRGYDVLTDIVALSHSREILCGASGIPVVAKTFNPATKLVNITGEKWN